jgi:phage terminase large subunit-like protein
MSVYTTVDLAISEKETADYTCVMTVGVNPENHWFILDIDFGRWNPSETIDAVFRAVQKHRPIYVGIEKIAYQASLEHFLLKEMPMRNVFFTIKPLMAEKKKEAALVEEENDALPYISPDTKILKGKLNHIYTAEPL